MIRVFVNPLSGRGAARAITKRWDFLDPDVIDFERFPSQLRKNIRPGDLIVVAGGDGTASFVVQSLFAAGMEADVTLALYPLGTGNDLARSLGCPRPPHPTAFIVSLRSDRYTASDVAVWRIGDRCAINYIGIGLDASILATADRWRRFFRTQPMLRKLSLGLAGLGHVAFRIKDDVRIRTDDGVIDLRETRGLIFSNVGYYGGGKRIGVHDPSEPLLSVTLLRRNTDLLRMMLSRHTSGPTLAYSRTAGASIDGTSIPAQIDGEVAVLSSGQITCAGHVRIACVRDTG